MKDVAFISGNENKIRYVTELLVCPIAHQKVDLEEIQSLDIRAVVEHKLEQAYRHVRRPVLVEDMSLEFTALGRLPGTFVKWFMDELGLARMCALLAGHERTATAISMFGYYDGARKEYFERRTHGTVPETPRGSGGYGWDPIFIPDGFTITRAEMSVEDDYRTYTAMKPLADVKAFLVKE